MALSLPRIPIPIPSSRTPTNYPNIQTPLKSTRTPISHFTTITKTNHRRAAVIVNAGEERQQQNPISESDPTQQNPPPPSNDEKEQTDLGTEIKKAMMDRDGVKKDDGFWGGVVEEIGKIEWPAFGKVIGTTGVVMGVIAGSSVVLLTVNAVLAELSDRVFVGKGIQDFFG